MDNTIILIGMSRVGKSSVGKSLAEKLKIPFFDTDIILEKKHQATIKEIFKKCGGFFFRESECKVFTYLLSKNQKMVVSTGGGIVENNLNLDLLQNRKNVVFLSASADFIFKRISAEIDESKTIPEFLKCNNANSKNVAKLNFTKIYKRRFPLYEKTANVTVSVEGKTVETVCEEILCSIK